MFHLLLNCINKILNLSVKISKSYQPTHIFLQKDITYTHRSYGIWIFKCLKLVKYAIGNQELQITYQNRFDK